MITLKMLLFSKLYFSVCFIVLCAALRCMQSGYAFDVKTYIAGCILSEVQSLVGTWLVGTIHGVCNESM